MNEMKLADLVREDVVVIPRCQYNNLLKCEAWLSLLLRGETYNAADLVRIMKDVIEKEETAC